MAGDPLYVMRGGEVFTIDPPLRARDFPDVDVRIAMLYLEQAQQQYAAAGNLSMFAAALRNAAAAATRAERAASDHIILAPVRASA